MAVASSLVPELDEVVKHGDPRRRAAAVRQISDLFVNGAAHFHAGHIELFDGVLNILLPETDSDLRGELAERLSGLGNAPPELVRQLARDEEIRIAGPLLRRSPLIDDRLLGEIARLRGQGHLLAISERLTLSSPITDVLVRRGDRDVLRRVAGNDGARLSAIGYGSLIRRAGQDGPLALAIGNRPDLSAPLLKDLLAGAADPVRRQLFEAADPAKKLSINWALSELFGLPDEHMPAKRDFGPAQRAVVTLLNAGQLNEAAILGFARQHRYEEAVAALSAMSGVRISTLDGLVAGERPDPLLILGKSIGLEWATVRALIALRLGSGRAAAPDIEDARLNFQRLAQPTAQRVLNFWRTREP
jgi:uncharacterized protein (DUF2336 family)